MRSGDRGGMSMAKPVAERFFCTEGPIRPERHYHVPPLQRIDLAAVRRLIGQWRYFVLHAPRQTGKTTALFALRDTLNAGGEYRCVYVNVEIGQAAREDVSAAMRAILDRLALEAERTLGDRTLAELWPPPAVSAPFSAAPCRRYAPRAGVSPRRARNHPTAGTRLARTVEQGLAQTRAYLDRSGAGEGHLVIFDRTPGKPWDAKLYRRRETAGGTTITVWGM